MDQCQHESASHADHAHASLAVLPRRILRMTDESED
jgi:hypothetical protein